MKTFNYKILKVMAFSVIMLFMSSSVFAQVQESKQDTTAQDTTVQMSDQQQTMPQEQNQQTTDDMKSQHPDEGVDYSETIQQSELPQDVNSSLDELYPAHEIQEAYRGGDDSYKVKVKNETDEAVVYYDAEGKFLRAENLSGLNQEGELPQEQSQQINEQDTVGYQQDAPQDAPQGDQQETQQDQWGDQEDEQDTEMKSDDTAAPQEQNQRTDDKLRSQDFDKGVDYSESMQEGDLPQDVTSSLDELYPAHEIEKIYQGNDDSYKVKVKNEDDVAVVYYDSQGDFLRAQNISDMEQQGALPQEQGQRAQDEQDDRGKQQEMHQGTMHDQKEMHQEKMHEQQSDQSEQWESDSPAGETQQQTQPEQWGTDADEVETQDVEDMQQDAEPQEQNQRIENVEESQDADRWGTENRMPEQERSQDANQQTWESDTTDVESQQDDWESQGDTLDTDDSAYPQEQNQQIEGTQDEDDWDSENTGTDHSTWQGGEGTDTTATPSRIDTTAVYNNQWEEDNIEEGDDTTLPQEQNQQMEGTQDEEEFEDNWGPEKMGAHQSTWEDGEGYPQEQNQQSTDDDVMEDQSDQSTWMGGEGTDTTATPSRIDTTAVYNNQWEEENMENGDDAASPQEQNQQTTEWGDADTTDTQDEFGTTPVDTTGTYNDQMMEDNTLDNDDTNNMDGTASPQEQFQTTGDEDVEYNEEVQKNELPETVTSSLDELYPEHEIEEAYRGEDGSYKIKVKNNDDKVAVYYDSEGLFSRDEELNTMLEKDNKDTNEDW